MLKIYRCRKTFFSTVVTYGGKNLRIEFRGGNIGSGGSSPSEYETDKKEIQDQVEQHAYYKNGIIWLVGAKAVKEPEKPVTPPIIPPVVETTTGDKTIVEGSKTEGNTPANSSDNITSVPEITNFQKAKNYLLKLGAVVPSTTNKDQLKEIAKGMSIEFPNLK